MREEEEK